MTIRTPVVGCVRLRYRQTQTASFIVVTTNNLYSFGRAHEERRRANLDLYCTLFWGSSVLFLTQTESRNVNEKQLEGRVEAERGNEVGGKRK